MTNTSPTPNDLVPVPVGVAVDPTIAPFVTPRPLVEPAQVQPSALIRPAARARQAPGPPPQLRGALNAFGQRTTATPLDPGYQRNLTTLTNKYQEMAPLIRQLPPAIRNALIDYDSRRVARGSAPLTREQTVLAAQTALTDEPATPEPDRSPWSILSNIGKDVADVLQSIPRLPSAIASEITELPQMGERIAEARAAGVNPITAILQAPGIRMVPGAYTLGNVAAGDINEVLSHPVMTALDVLPAAHGIAAGTRVGRAARTAQITEAAARSRPVPRPRPVSAVLTNRLGPDGVLERNVVGQTIDVLRQDTRLGQALESFGGRTAREVARIGGKLDQRLKALMIDVATPANVVESFGPRISRLFDRYADQYPSLARDAIGPEHDVWRAGLYRDVQRNPQNWDPGFVAELRDLQVDMARYNQSQGLLDTFDGEWYPTDVARTLRTVDARVGHAERMVSYRNEFVNPSGRLTPQWFRDRASEIVDVTDVRMRLQQARALEQTLDAYGIDASIMKGDRARLHLEPGAWSDWQNAVLDSLNGVTQLTPRASLTDLARTLRQMGADRQATLLEQAIRNGDRHQVTARLKNLYERKIPNIALDDQFRADARSLSRRLDFDNRYGRRYTSKRVGQLRATRERRIGENAPARFHALLRDEVVERGARTLQGKTEAQLGRTLTADEAAEFVRAVESEAWRDLPGIDPTEAADMMAKLERDVVSSWRKLRDAGHDPVFVHKVGAGRAGLTGRIGPTPQALTQVRERRLDLTPDVQDLQVSLTDQAAELLSQDYSARFVEEVVDLVGVTEAQLRDRLLATARWRADIDPQLTVKGHLEETIRRGWERFNPDADGFSWGGARLDKYRQDAVYIPRAIAKNLKGYTKRTDLFTALADPVTKAFRYQVIGLSPSIIVNNFFSNSIAFMAESGPGAWKYWGRAREWLADPKKIPNEELKALIVAEAPFMEHLGRERWLASRTGQKFMAGFNAGTAFMDSAALEAVKAGKRAVDGVVEKSMAAQRWGDNVYRVMQYMAEVDKGVGKLGLEAGEATARALEMVRQTFVDYASFTPVERSALRTIVPFYSYMSHAARFVARYPLNHPVRMQLAASLARAERERLGALPGSFLAMIPLPAMFGGGMDPQSGKQTFLDMHRLFNPFDDTADMLSVAGWVSAMNPSIQVALQQIGVVRGESDLYPTLRYDPETGRMRAVHPGLLESVMSTVFPRLGPVTSLLGINPQFNELAARDPDAARRSLMGQAGIPRIWREFNVPQEQFRGEVSRQQSANDVLNEAMRTGDWTEAMRYPSLRPYYDQLQALTPDQIAAMTPAQPGDIAQQITQLTGAAP